MSLDSQNQDKKSNIISFHYAKLSKKMHDDYCVSGTLKTLGVLCEYCSLKKRINVQERECIESEILIGESY